MNRLIVIMAVMMCSVSVAAGSVTYVDDFEGGANPTGWAWNGFNGSIPATGGNPGGFLHDDDFFSWAKVSSTIDAPTSFHGDYRAMDVTEISFDTLTVASPYGYTGMPSAIGLFNWDLGIYTYTNGPCLDGPGPWVTTTFAIPSQDSNPGPWSFPVGGTWDDLITNVDQVVLFYLTPDYGSIGASGFDVGLDNASITLVPEPATLGLLCIGGLALLRRRH